MTEWWNQLWAGLRARGGVAVPLPAAASSEVPVAADDGELADPDTDLVAWLLDSEPLRSSGLDGAETRGLAWLDGLVDAARAPVAGWLAAEATAVLISVNGSGARFRSLLTQSIARKLRSTV